MIACVWGGVGPVARSVCVRGVSCTGKSQVMLPVAARVSRYGWLLLRLMRCACMCVAPGQKTLTHEVLRCNL